MADEMSEGRPPSGPWIVAFALALMVTIAGFVVAVQQFVVKYVIDNWAHTRTLPGVLFMLLGIVGIGLPVLLFLKRRKFGERPASRQWLAAFVMPLTYVLVFVLLVESSLRSTNMILPRAETPTAIVGYEYGRVHVDFRTRKGRGGGFSIIEKSNGIERFSAHYKTGHSPRRDYSTRVEIRGQTQPLEDGKLQIDLDVDAGEPIAFAVEDFELVEITHEGRAIDDSDSLSGKFQVSIVARLAKNSKQ